MTIVNVVRSLTRGAIAGPDPWKGNTLEWFVPSPPPVNNFDVIPRVRSVEPMQDIRREIERRRGAPRPEAGASDRSPAETGSRHRRAMEASRRRRARGRPEHSPRRASLLADYFALTKPKVQSLLLFTTVTTM